MELKEKYTYRRETRDGDLGLQNYFYLVENERFIDINEKIEFPKYLEREILYEVTGIKEFSNKRLAK